MIHITCNIDDNYVEYCGVMLTSLFVSNPRQSFFIHIINNGIATNSKKRLLEFAKSFHAEMEFYDIPKSMTNDFPIHPKDYLSIATYLRIFMPEVLPKSIDKILYLDCDLVVIDSIMELWETDITSFAIAALEERPPFDSVYPEKLGYPVEYSYFNAGVMLVNLKRCREMELTSLCTNFIANNYHRIKYHDQDVLNAVLHKEIFHLSLKWNLMDFFFDINPNLQENRMDDLHNALKQPAIIHFAGPRKPWLYSCNNPFRNLYIQLAKDYHWEVITTKESIHYYLRKEIYSLLYLLRLKKRKVLKNYVFEKKAL